MTMARALDAEGRTSTSARKGQQLIAPGAGSEGVEA
jgi:hypothetical protein